MAMFTCFYRQAAELDDHVSDASTIARAVVQACHPQFDEWKFSSFEELPPPVDAQLFYKRMGESASNLALEVVLRVRAKPKH